MWMVGPITPLSSLTFHLKIQEIWFWLRGNLLSFPASTFGSEDFTTCFRTDITMEQVLMCSGDVTRGHGISMSNQAEPAQPI